MNRLTIRTIKLAGTFTAVVATSLVLFGCAVTPSSPPGAAETRSKLSALQDDPNLGQRARVEIQEAEVAVRLAEQPLDSSEGSLAEHRVYMADRKVEIARAKATTRFAEHERTRFAEERDAARLASRTQEADRARFEAGRARDDASRERSSAEAARMAEAEAAADASRARSEAQAARGAQAESAAEAERRAAELERQIAALEAEVTDRGLVLTLGDVLFATGSAELQGAASSRLNKLVDFLNQYPNRRVLIEGHTDNVGNAAYNQDLSLRRADSVRGYLTGQGIGSQRVSTSGMGLNQPIADNNSAAGRQQNRRVEIVIENPPLVRGSG